MGKPPVGEADHDTLEELRKRKRDSPDSFVEWHNLERARTRARKALEWYEICLRAWNQLGEDL